MPKASRPADIATERINGGRLSFAGNFAGVIVSMCPFLAGRIASAAPGPLVVQFGGWIAGRRSAARNLPEQADCVDEA
jgi:hypothetical protein